MMNLLYFFQCGRTMQTPSASRTVVQAHSKLILRVPESGHSLVIWQTGSTAPRGISRITIMTGLDRCVPASHSRSARRANIIDLGLKDGFDLFTGAWVSRGPASALGLFYDSRPLFTRSVRLKNHICGKSLMVPCRCRTSAH